VSRQTSAQRKKRPRESQVWPRAAAAIGVPPPSVRWVHVGDAYADMFDFWQACRAQGADFWVRVCQDRVLRRPHGPPNHLLRMSTVERLWPHSYHDDDIPRVVRLRRPAERLDLLHALAAERDEEHLVLF
jgi:hypothetical protein